MTFGRFCQHGPCENPPTVRSETGGEYCKEHAPIRTLAELAQEALDVQNACNLCGVAQGFAQAMIELGAYCPDGTYQRNRHPITRLWVDKLMSLAGRDVVSSDWKSVVELAKGNGFARAAAERMLDARIAAREEAES